MKTEINGREFVLVKDFTTPVVNGRGEDMESPFALEYITGRAVAARMVFPFVLTGEQRSSLYKFGILTELMVEE